MPKHKEYQSANYAKALIMAKCKLLQQVLNYAKS